jgi:hypothetical protein
MVEGEQISVLPTLPKWSPDQAKQSMAEKDGASGVWELNKDFYFTGKVKARIKKNEAITKELQRLHDTLPPSCPPRLRDIVSAQVASFKNAVYWLVPSYEGLQVRQRSQHRIELLQVIFPLVVALAATAWAEIWCANENEICGGDDSSQDLVVSNSTTFLETRQDVYALGVYVQMGVTIIAMIYAVVMYSDGVKFFKSNAALFESMGIGAKDGLQRYDVDHATEEDIAEGLADLCADAISSCDACAQFAKFIMTQILISAGSVLGIIANAESTTTVMALCYASGVGCGKFTIASSSFPTPWVLRMHRD